MRYRRTHQQPRLRRSPNTVRDGVDGYRIPTVMPDAGAGHDLAQRYDDGVDGYDTYCGHTSQAVAVDGPALAQACARLAGDAALRVDVHGGQQQLPAGALPFPTGGRPGGEGGFQRRRQPGH